ncbi:hypothetical protein [Chelativorans sp. AA-79]|uniref:hypothetical protein n=1 Tax=Chelativorans sp. AA-79 TaxID=3028735 RepID=UPI0023F8A301|nr:hypothetical protein [Chelativorans sp. AA-79]WEX07289.1 hypothetical protein PVE73_14225 [Chelativorans sp. AA-79]
MNKFDTNFEEISDDIFSPLEDPFKRDEGIETQEAGQSVPLQSSQSVWARRKQQAGIDPIIKHRLREIEKSSEPDDVKRERLTRLAKELADSRNLLVGTHAARSRGWGTGGDDK